MLTNYYLFRVARTIRIFAVISAIFTLSVSCSRPYKILVPTVNVSGALPVNYQQPEYYSLNEYTVQKCYYEIASIGIYDQTSNCKTLATDKSQSAITSNDMKTEDATRARKLRNSIIFGLMTDIDLVYNYQYNRIFNSRSLSATVGDGITLGLGATGAIAAQKATKTIMAALQTAFTGLNASIGKNYFAEQSFQVLGMAMATRRDKVRKGIIEALAQDDTAYPLNQAKRDLISYAQAGTLPAALQELQEEAGVASRDVKKPDTTTVTSSAPTDVTANRGILANALVWRPVSGASVYTVYWSETSPITRASAKLPPITSNNVLDRRPNTAKVFYAITATISGQESDLSSEVNATPINDALDPAAKLPAPTAFRAVSNAGAVVITFDAPENSVSFIVNSSINQEGSDPTAVGVPGSSNLVTINAPNAEKLFYQVIAVNRNGVSGTPSKWISPSALPPAEKKKPDASKY